MASGTEARYLRPAVFLVALVDEEGLWGVEGPGVECRVGGLRGRAVAVGVCGGPAGGGVGFRGERVGLLSPVGFLVEFVEGQ